jgi:hypothetical protein
MSTTTTEPTSSSSPIWLTILIAVVLAVVEGYVLTAGQTHG